MQKKDRIILISYEKQCWKYAQHIAALPHHPRPAARVVVASSHGRKILLRSFNDFLVQFHYSNMLDGAVLEGVRCNTTVTALARRDVENDNK